MFYLTDVNTMNRPATLVHESPELGHFYGLVPSRSCWLGALGSELDTVRSKGTFAGRRGDNTTGEKASHMLITNTICYRGAMSSYDDNIKHNGRL